MRAANAQETVARFAGWLPYLTAGDREYVRTQRANVAGICAEDPTAPPWLEYLCRWTLAALDAEDPASALRDAVATTAGDPDEIGRALIAIDRISDLWEGRYRPRSQIVGGEPYPLNSER